MSKKEYDPLDICHNIMDLIELHCYEYVKYPLKRAVVLERVMFYVGLPPREALLDFGRMCIRMTIVSVLNDLREGNREKLATKSDVWDSHIGRLEQLKITICREDAFAVIVPYRVNGVTTEDSVAGGQLEEYYKKKNESERNDAVDEERAKMPIFTTRFNEIVAAMRLQQGLSLIRTKYESGDENAVNVESLSNLREFVYEQVESNYAMKMDYLEMIKSAEQAVYPNRTQKGEEILKIFGSLDKVCESLEELMIEWHKLLPRPNLVRVNYELEMRQMQMEEYSSYTVTKKRNEKRSSQSPSSCASSRPSSTKRQRSTKANENTSPEKGAEAKQKHLLANLKKEYKDPLPELIQAASAAQANTAVSEYIPSPTQSQTPSHKTQKKKKNIDFEDSSAESDGGRKSAASTPTSKRPSKPRVRWTEVEIKALHEGIEKHGIGRWAVIKADYPLELKNRTSVNIKDRYRTEVNRGTILVASVERGNTSSTELSTEVSTVSATQTV